MFLKVKTCSVVCLRCGISRQWVRPFQPNGIDGLKGNSRDRSRRRLPKFRINIVNGSKGCAIVVLAPAESKMSSTEFTASSFPVPLSLKALRATEARPPPDPGGAGPRAYPCHQGRTGGRGIARTGEKPSSLNAAGSHEPSEGCECGYHLNRS